MCVKIPVYVAGLDLGVLPIGFWSILMTLSILSVLTRFLKGSISFTPKLTRLDKAGYKVWFMSELLPLPDTPVMAINLSYGKLTSIFFKLFPEAPRSEK